VGSGTHRKTSLAFDRSVSSNTPNPRRHRSLTRSQDYHHGPAEPGVSAQEGARWWEEIGRQSDNGAANVRVAVRGLLVP